MESGRSEARNSAGQSSERQLGPNLFRSALIAGESYSGSVCLCCFRLVSLIISPVKLQRGTGELMMMTSE